MADTFYSRSGERQVNDVQYNSLKSLRMNVHRFLPKKLQRGCLRPNEEHKKQHRSYMHILEETSISHIVQQLRVLNAAAQETRTKKEWKKLRQQHALMAYSDLESETQDMRFSVR